MKKTLLFLVLLGAVFFLLLPKNKTPHAEDGLIAQDRISAKTFNPDVALVKLAGQGKVPVPASGFTLPEGLSQEKYDEILTYASMHRGDLESTHPLVRETALEDIDANVVSAIPIRTAKLCGFSSFESLERALASDDPVLANLRPTLLSLSERASTAADSLRFYFERSWENSERVEVWDKNEEHDSSKWASDHGIDKTESAFESATSVLVGQWVMVLHFRSADFPEVELELAAIKSMREAYWDSVATMQPK